MSVTERLESQLRFIVEIDKIKNIYRQTLLISGDRNENDAEHSWHLAMMALLLSEYANDSNIDLARVIKMVLVHDIVEIDAGDTFCYDEEAAKDKSERETRAADRIFGILPDDQMEELRELWEEFEAMDTPESRFAAALDRLQPLLHNYHTQGAAWQKHGIKIEQVLSRNRHIADGSELLWKYSERLIQESLDKGYLAE